MKKKSKDLDQIPATKQDIKNLEFNIQDVLSAIRAFASDVTNRFQGVDKRFDGVETRLNNLEFNQEEILLKLDNKASKLDVIDLAKRVGVLETK